MLSVRTIMKRNKMKRTVYAKIHPFTDPQAAQMTFDPNSVIGLLCIEARRRVTSPSYCGTYTSEFRHQMSHNHQWNKLTDFLIVIEAG
jgi:hypothetical protein